MKICPNSTNILYIFPACKFCEQSFQHRNIGINVYAFLQITQPQFVAKFLMVNYEIRKHLLKSDQSRVAFIYYRNIISCIFQN